MAAGRRKARDERNRRGPLRGRDRRRRHMYRRGAVRRGASRCVSARRSPPRPISRTACSPLSVPRPTDIGLATDTLLARTALFMHGSDGRGQHAVHPLGRQDRPDHHRRLRGHAGHHPRRLRPLGRPHRGRHQAPGGDRPRPTPGAPRKDQGRAGAGGLQGAPCCARWDEDAVRRAIRSLVEDEEIEALAVSFLWSFYNATHEQRVGALIRESAPGVYVTLSSEIAPVPGEYERASTDRHQRLRRAHRERLHHQPAGTAAGAGLRRAAARDAGLWRPAAGG